jgi:small subunit ribosomal protein S1
MPKTTVNEKDFAELLKDFPVKLPNKGDIVKGTIISIDNGVVRIDVGGVAVGVIRGNELFGESREYSNLAMGSEVEAIVIEDENETGEMELSFRAAGKERVWDAMMKLRDDGITIDCKILQANKGGLLLQVDALTGFLPVSQLSPEHYPRVPGGDKSRILEQLKLLIGQTVQAKIIDVNQADEKLIVSEKAVWEDSQKAVLDAYKIGDTISGEVSALTSFGAFIKFGEGLEGLVHISEIVWQRIDHPRDVLKVGDSVKAQIIDLNKSKIYLSMKRLIDDPWKSVKDTYKVGQIIHAEVHKIEPFGLMVKLDDQIHGLAHVSELSDTPIKSVEDVKKLFETGVAYDFEIVSIEPNEHRLGLKVPGVKGKQKKEVVVEDASKDAEVAKDSEDASKDAPKKATKASKATKAKTVDAGEEVKAE